MPQLYPGRRYLRTKAPLQIVRGYYPTEPGHLSVTAKPKDAEGIAQGMAICLDNNGQWIKADAAARTHLSRSVYVARQDQDDPAVQSSGELVGLSLAGKIELLTGYIVAGTFALDSEITVEAGTGNFIAAIGSDKVVAKVSAIGAGAGGLIPYTGLTPPTDTAAHAARIQIKTVAAYTKPDTTPPSPDPMTFASAPAAVNATSVTMRATTAVDADGNGVEYFFTCTAGGGHNSAWQASPTYVDTGLTTATTYTYTVKARETSLGLNQTAASAPASATTP